MQADRSVLRQIAAVFIKDMRREARSKEVTTTTVAFAVMLMVIFAFAFYQHDETVGIVFPGILWISVIFAGTLAITRTFDQERQGGCLRALALIPGTDISLYAGKLMTNLIFMAVFEAVLIPLVALSFDVDLMSNWAEHLAIIAGVTVGFSALGTLVSAVLVHSHLRDVMLPIFLYPMAVPLIIAGVKVTRALVETDNSENVWMWIQLVAGVDILFVLASFLMFRWVLSAIE